jgi:queuine tRNA-ribosyltransferase
MFSLHASDDQARRGLLPLAHGEVQTPIFMPVGTVGSVKTLVPSDLKEIQAEIILGNTYHLFLRPGLEVIESFGGLHDFVGWQGPILTDSGGFQIFSLGKLKKLNEEGVEFQSHLDGSRFKLSPEKAVAIQETLGSDIHMVLDECTEYTLDKDRVASSMRRSMRWAARCRRAKIRPELKQFGIVQGGMFADLRRESAAALVELDFEGYAIGGLSVGESKAEMLDMLAVTCEVLPKDKPRYLMGVGTPLDILEAINLGVDMFDCVMPTRNARNGGAFTSTGPISIKNAKYRLDHEPLDAQCRCYTCRTFSRAYLRHLFVAEELTVLRLLTLHNLTFYLDLIHQCRAAIEGGKFQSLLSEHRELWKKKAQT